MVITLFSKSAFVWGEVEEIVSKQDAIMAEKTKADCIAILLLAQPDAGVSHPPGVEMLNRISQKFPKNALSFTYSTSKGVHKRYMLEGDILPMLVHISKIDENGEKMRKKRNQLKLKLNEIAHNHLDSEDVGTAVEAFLVRQTIPTVVQVPGDGTPDTQARFELLHRTLLPKMYTFSNTRGNIAFYLVWKCFPSYLLFVSLRLK